MNHRFLIEKRPDFANTDQELETLRQILGLSQLNALRKLVLYDVFNLPEAYADIALKQVFSDPVSDEVHANLPPADYWLVIEPLAGQFDQRADSAEQVLKLIDASLHQTRVCTAIAYGFIGNLSEQDKQTLKQHLINPIETREKSLSQQCLPEAVKADAVCRYPQFITLNSEELAEFHQAQGLAMTLADLALVQAHFKAENRAPSETEIRLLDTYWSDHCRHSTFNTHLKEIVFPDTPLGQAMQADLADIFAKRHTIYAEKADARALTLMELATIQAKYLIKTGALSEVESSAEINACSVFVDVNSADAQVPKTWLLQFKNETHNHPTEIEPYGGAATCIGGAIRDPLSGRAYVYQALRLSGSADPREPIAHTLAGKLPQRVIAQQSAAGASSYGNQIGLATGQVVELYHEGYKAKHMEVGAVVAATPAANVKREVPCAGDVVLLIGGATGRDGCGGATGSSRGQNAQSLSASAAEVQKGNPPEERKLQRLFRQSAFAQKIKRCNDFGAGGVSVAIGELAEGIRINLDAIPVKYQGLNGTELAISESQERMAVVIAASDVAEIIRLAALENLTATVIAEITDDQTLTMHWQGETIVSLPRALLDSNGAIAEQAQVLIDSPDDTAHQEAAHSADWQHRLIAQLQHLNHADLRGLGDRFDFNVGAGCILKPYGGLYHATPIEASAYLLPTDAPCSTASILAYGFEPDGSARSPYHGAINAVVEASARLIATGGDIRRSHFSLQEYFARLGNVPSCWGAPVAALLGAHYALSRLGRAAIGGKDSMSGSFAELDVPPTLIAFAVSVAESAEIISPEFKAANHYLYWLRCPVDAHGRVEIETLLAHNDTLQTLNREGAIASIRSIRHGGIIQALYECALGNQIGCVIDAIDAHDLFAPEYGSFLISSPTKLAQSEHWQYLGQTCHAPSLTIAGQSIALDALMPHSQSLADIYPQYAQSDAQETDAPSIVAKAPKGLPSIGLKIATPRVCLPVFYGTNSELDTARAFTRAGAEVKEILICNRHQQDIESSLEALSQSLRNSQIFVLSGGFSAGDEPDGSGKFIANILFNQKIREAIDAFLAHDGLILGICNGFQALIKSGLLPTGKIAVANSSSPTLTHNSLFRHIARIASTKIVNNHSPWLSQFALDEVHDLAFSHGEGRFYADKAQLEALIANGQIATQYVNPHTLKPSLDSRYNPNGSVYAIEGITSPCGRIFGKMGHSERYQAGLYKNHPNFRPQDIFCAGVRAFQ